MRAVMTGYVNYRYNNDNGELPSHTKRSFEEYNILTIHGIIIKNALLFMHKKRHFPRQLPPSIIETIPNNAPIVGSDHDSCNSWFESYGRTPYCSSIFYKAPLLAISQENVNMTTLPSLFSLNIYKKSVKQGLINLQSNGDNTEWPSFLLYNIPGLRRSART